MQRYKNEHEAALANDQVRFIPKETKVTDETEIPTREEFEKGGGNPEQYEKYIAKKQDDLAADVMVKAEKVKTRTAKVKAKGGLGAWRTGQTHYMIPSKAPRDYRKQDPYTPEPGLRIPIGRVSEVPIRDDAHEACLREDPNLEFVADATMTHEQEKAIVDAAVADARAKADAKAAPQDKRAKK